MSLISCTDFITDTEILNITQPPESQKTEKNLYEKIQETPKISEFTGSILGSRKVANLTEVASRVVPCTVKIEIIATSQTIYNSAESAYPAHGSGFFISSDGYIVTNHHVIEGAKNIKIILKNGQHFPATIKGSDPETDIALLKIEAENLPYLSFADSDLAQIGESTLLVGNPLGLSHLLTLGVLGGKGSGKSTYAGPWIPEHLGKYADYLIADTTTLPGNSGGPLLNRCGEVIGVCTRAAMGIGIHIASNTAHQVVNALMTEGHVTRSWFGAQVDSLEDFPPVENFPEKGLVILNLIEDSPAMQSGLKKHDVIIQCNGEEVLPRDQFYQDLAMKMSPGSEMKLSILREGQPIEITVILGSRLVDMSIPIEKLGMRIQNLNDDKLFEFGFDTNIQGVFISEVECNLPANQAGLRPTDIITGAIVMGQEKRIANVDDFLDILKMSEDKTNILLTIRSSNRSCQDYRYVNF